MQGSEIATRETGRWVSLRSSQTLGRRLVQLKKRHIAQNLGSTSGWQRQTLAPALTLRKHSWRKDCYTDGAAVDAAGFSRSVGRGS